ncbi:hypothetical protein GF371_04780 [Candidatus Woesearchaeota archaeon]|nr:hypothetical protein [Candidatus Woesearchaeota archaeon]
MKNPKILIILLVIFFVIVLILVLRKPAVPVEPGLPKGPIGAAGQALPDWLTIAKTKMQMFPSDFELHETTETAASVKIRDDYVFGYIYVLSRDNKWLPVKLDCPRFKKTNWCRGKVETFIPVSLDLLSAGDNFVIAYTCSIEKGKEHDCNGGKWLLLPFYISGPGTVRGGPELQTPKGPCTDSDEGKDYYKQGTVTFPGGTYIDECKDYTRLLEGYCEGDVFVTETFSCPGQCEDGICKEMLCKESLCRKRNGFCCPIGTGVGRHIGEGRFDDDRFECYSRCQETSQADLVIDSIVFLDKTDSESIEVGVYVKNIGGGKSTGTFYVAGEMMNSDETIISGVYKQDIEPDDRAYLRMEIPTSTLPYRSLGPSLKLYADSEDSIEELDEFNNEWMGSVRFSGTVHKLR